MGRGCLIALSLVAGLGAGTGIAQAQTSEFACPKAGTVEERGSYKTQYTGAAASDPYVCNSTDTWNKPQALLFNFYRVQDVPVAEVRPAMLDLLSGRKSTVTVTTAAGGTETWSVLRHEPVTVAGKTMDTIVLAQDRERFPNSMHPFHGQYVRWLDAKDGLWVRAELKVITGEGAMERKPYRDSAITIP